MEGSEGSKTGQREMSSLGTGWKQVSQPDHGYGSSTAC